MGLLYGDLVHLGLFRAVSAEGSGGATGRWPRSVGDGGFILARAGIWKMGEPGFLPVCLFVRGTPSCDENDPARHVALPHVVGGFLLER